jgi:hypothetical protein
MNVHSLSNLLTKPVLTSGFSLAVPGHWEEYPPRRLSAGGPVFKSRAAQLRCEASEISYACVLSVAGTRSGC